ncbi:MAG: hypothetical protein HYX91_03625 [Chloroflexi bacterium]|nr:hypothetical protein [Chloroflexota bacterium]
MRRYWPFIAAFILFALGDFLIYSDGTDAWWQYVPGFFAVFGLVFCVVIVIASKFLGHLWLQRREDYYDRDDNNG